MGIAGATHSWLESKMLEKASKMLEKESKKGKQDSRAGTPSEGAIDWYQSHRIVLTH